MEIFAFVAGLLIGPALFVLGSLFYRDMYKEKG